MEDRKQAKQEDDGDWEQEIPTKESNLRFVHSPYLLHIAESL